MLTELNTELKIKKRIKRDKEEKESCSSLLNLMLNVYHLRRQKMVFEKEETLNL